MKRLDFLFISIDVGLFSLKTEMKMPPLGPLSIASFLKSRGYNAKVIDASRSFFSISWLEDYLAEFSPRYVGFTIYTEYLHSIKRLISIVRRVSPSSSIVCGGPHATICDKATLDEVGADIVVRGYGEIPSLELVAGRGLAEIDGISYFENGQYRSNGNLVDIKLELLPSPDPSLIEPHHDFYYIPAIITGRGCPYKCSFCAAGILSKKVVFRPMELVKQDIITILPYCKKEILSILDDTFTLDRNRVSSFCRMIKSIGGGKDILWYAEGRISSIKRDPEILAEMYDAGLRFLQFGIESGNYEVLRAYNKDVDLDYALDMVAECARIGIFMHTNFIVGGPFETDETIEQTKNYAKKLVAAGNGYLSIGFPFLTPLPGTEIFNVPEKYGLKILDRNLLSSVMFDNAVTETENLSRSEIIWHRFGIMAEVLGEMFDIMKSPDVLRHERCLEASSLAGEFHMTFVADRYIDWNNYFVSSWKGVFAKVSEYRQFLETMEEPFERLIPIRTSAVVVNSDGNVDFPHITKDLSQIQSRVLNLCAGKLTVAEIASRLGDSITTIQEALIELENIKAVIYRTF